MSKTFVFEIESYEGVTMMAFEITANGDELEITKTSDCSHADTDNDYIFETDAGKLLDVAFNGIHDCPFVNGIEVEDNDLFYELIDPFLTDEDRGILYKQFQP